MRRNSYEPCEAPATAPWRATCRYVRAGGVLAISAGLVLVALSGESDLRFLTEVRRQRELPTTLERAGRPRSSMPMQPPPSPPSMPPPPPSPASPPAQPPPAPPPAPLPAPQLPAPPPPPLPTALPTAPPPPTLPPAPPHTPPMLPPHAPLTTTERINERFRRGSFGNSTVLEEAGVIVHVRASSLSRPPAAPLSRPPAAPRCS